MERGITVIDDYGHHPTEIRATLAAARLVRLSRRMHVLFQPHRYTRTFHLLDDFARAFHQADRSSCWISTRLRRSPSKASPRKRWWSACASSAIAAWNTWARSNAAVEALLAVAVEPATWC